MNISSNTKQPGILLLVVSLLVSFSLSLNARADGLVSDYAMLPPLISTEGSGDTPNILLMLDNSGSMNENSAGVTVGSNHKNSRTVIARQAIAEILARFGGSANMGLMAFQPPPNNAYNRVSGTNQTYEWSGQNVLTNGNTRYAIRSGYLHIPIGNVNPNDASAGVVAQLNEFNRRLGLSVVTQPAPLSGRYNLFGFSASTYVNSSDYNPNRRIVSFGGTPLEGTFNSALQYYNGTLSSSLIDPGIPASKHEWPKTSQCTGRDYAIMITDGLPTVNMDGTFCSTASCTTAIYNSHTDRVVAQATALRDAGVTSFVIGFAVGVNNQDEKALLDRMAKAGGGSDVAYVANDLGELVKALESIFTSIINRPSSGTGAAFETNRGDGVSVSIRTMYTPEKTDGTKTVKWAGQLMATFFDGKLYREDTNQNGLLDGYNVDRVLRYGYNAVLGKSYVERVLYSSAVDPSDSNIVSIVETDLESIKPVWSARDQLAAVTDVITQRNYSAVANTGRRIYTSVDGENMIGFTHIDTADLVDLETTESDLRTQISDLNDDVANSQGNLAANVDTLNTVLGGDAEPDATTLAAALADARTQLEIDFAQEVADLQAAQTAHDTAETALNQANANLAQANDTLTAANTAQSDAQTAQVNAANDLAAANQAQTDAQTALTNATAAELAAQGDLGAAQSTEQAAVLVQQTAQTNLSMAQSDADAAQTQRDAAQNVVDTATTDLTAANAAVAAATTAASDAQVNLDSANAALADATSALTAAEAVRDSAETVLTAAQSAYQTAVDAFNAELASDPACAGATCQSLQNDVSLRQADVDAAQNTFDAADADVQQADQVVTDAAGFVAAADAALDQANTTLADATTAQSVAQTSFDIASADFAAAETVLATEQSELAAAQSVLESANSDLLSAQNALSAAQSAYDDAVAARVQSQADLVTADGAVATAQAALNAADDTLAAANAAQAAAQTVFNEATATQSAAQADFDAASTALADAQADQSYVAQLLDNVNAVESWLNAANAAIAALDNLLDRAEGINGETAAGRTQLLADIATLESQLAALLASAPVVLGDSRLSALSAAVAALLADLGTINGQFSNPGGTVDSFNELVAEVDGLMTSRETAQTSLVNTLAQIDEIAHIKYMDDGIVGQAGDVDLTYSQRNDIVKWVRGEEMAGLRNRTMKFEDGGTEKVWRLPDIVHSTPAIVGRPDEAYYLQYNDITYREYVEKKFNRRQVVYSGSNGGLLHAFNGGFWDDAKKGYVTRLDADTTSTQHPLGSELWAYVPKSALPHLQFIADEGYSHMFLVDGAPQRFDVNIFPANETYPNGWGTILVVNMRLGGGPFTVRVDEDGDGVVEDVVIRPSVMIFDVTDPEVEPKLIAELVHPDMGHTLGRPALIKNRKRNADGSFENPAVNRWALVFGSGPTNLQAASSNQNARLYVYDLNQREWATDWANNPLSITLESGAYIADIKAVDWDSDYVDDALYFGLNTGDAAAPRGRLARLRLRSDSGASSWLSNASLGTLINTDRTVIGAPSVKVDGYGRIWVSFGTGRLYVALDNVNAEQQYLFGVMEPVDADGDLTFGSVSTASLLDTSDIKVVLATGALQNGPTGVDDVNELEYHIQQNHGGWRLELVHAVSNPSGRNYTRAAEFLNVVIFDEYIPNSDVCKPEGNSYARALSILTGTPTPEGYLSTYLDASNEEIISGSSLLGVGASGGSMVIHTQTGPVLVGGLSTGVDFKYDISEKAAAVRRQSWRQIFDFGF